MARKDEEMPSYAKLMRAATMSASWPSPKQFPLNSTSEQYTQLQEDDTAPDMQLPALISVYPSQVQRSPGWHFKDSTSTIH